MQEPSHFFFSHFCMTFPSNLSAQNTIQSSPSTSMEPSVKRENSSENESRSPQQISSAANEFGAVSEKIINEEYKM